MESQLPTTKTDNAGLSGNPVNSRQKLFNTIFTKQDLLIFYKEIDQIITHMFMGDGNFEEIIRSILSPDKKESVISFLNTEKINMKNLVDIKVALSKIQKTGDALPVVSLTLAIEPTTSMIKNISFWFTKRLDRKVILDFALARNFIGGAYVAYAGLYKDYTLKTKVERYFEKTI